MKNNSGIRVLTSCVADHYAGTDERIIEFTDSKTNHGGLISFRRAADGRLFVHVYNQDPGTVVPPTMGERDLLAALTRLTEKVERANAIQHSGGRVRKEDWSELYAIANEARTVIAQATQVQP